MQVVFSLVLICFDSPQRGIQFRDVLHFDYLEKSLGIVSPPHFVNDFSRKMFLMLYSIK